MQQENAVRNDVRMDFLKDFASQLSSGEVDLPPFPDAYARILAALDDPDISLPQVAKVVAGAPDLAVRVLLMANSALLNRSGVEVTDLSVAVSRLGASAVRNAAVSLATRELFDADKDSPWYAQLRELHGNAVTTAAMAYALAPRAGLSRLRDNAMLTGLLHNTGSLYILSRAEHFPQFANQEAMEHWGPGIGRAIIENWGFPEEIGVAVEHQNLKEACHPGAADVRDLLIVSKQLARLRQQKDPDLESFAQWDQAAPFQKLEISHINALEVLEEMNEELESFLGAFR